MKQALGADYLFVGNDAGVELKPVCSDADVSRPTKYDGGNLVRATRELFGFRPLASTAAVSKNLDYGPTL